MADTKREWETKGTCTVPISTSLYDINVHVPCGTTVLTLTGKVRICPTCQPDQKKRMAGT
jgi:hypothetical protein